MKTAEFNRVLGLLRKRQPGLHGKDFLLTWDKSAEQLEAVLLAAEGLRHL